MHRVHRARASIWCVDLISLPEPIHCKAKQNNIRVDTFVSCHLCQVSIVSFSTFLHLLSYAVVVVTVVVVVVLLCFSIRFFGIDVLYPIDSQSPPFGQAHIYYAYVRFFF